MTSNRDPSGDRGSSDVTDDESSTTGETTRRTVLRLVGAGAAVSFVTGLGAATPGRGRNRNDRRGRNSKRGREDRRGRKDKRDRSDRRDRKGKRDRKDGRDRNGKDPKDACECPDGYSYHKFDETPVAGETYSFGSGSDAVSITVTGVEKNDENEVTSFTFDSDDSIRSICVKGGPVVEQNDFDGEPVSGGTAETPHNPNSGKPYGLSNFAICGSPGDSLACYQVDLVTGDPLCQLDPENGETYSAQGRRVTSIVVCSDGNVNPVPEDYAENASISILQADPEGGDCVKTSEDEGPDYLSAFDFDASSMTVTADWTEACPGQKVTLVAYRLPPGVYDYSDETASQQVLVDCASAAAGTATDGGSLTVDLEDGNCSAC